MIEEYGSLYWFYILTLISIPAVVIGLLGKPLRAYSRIATVLMVVLVIGWTSGQWLWLLGFLVFELTLIKGWLRYRVGNQHVNPWVARLAAAGATLPLVVIKVGNVFPTLSVGFLGISYLSFRIIQVVLEKCSAEPMILDSVKEALPALRRFRPHILISDIAMPKEDGYDLIRKVRRSRQNSVRQRGRRWLPSGNRSKG